MAFAGKQPRSRVESDPAGAGNIDLGPGVQVGEILLGAGRPVQGLHIRHQLHQVARHEARRQPHVAQHLHQQPAGVAAGAELFLQRFLAGLHARFHADGIVHRAVHALVDVHQEIHHRLARARHSSEEGLQPRALLAHFQIGRQFLLQLLGIVERKVFGVFLEEEIKRVDHRHFGDQIHLDRQYAGFFREHHARQVIPERILLPVDEMLFRLDLQRIRRDRRARMRRRP